jgi:GTP-binding protein
VEWEGSVFTLIDTGGFEPISKDRIFIQMREQCQLAIDEADVIFFMMDGKDGLTPSDREIADILRRQNKTVFFIVNKIDGPKHDEKVYEFYGLGIERIYPISAEHRYGFDELMDEVVKILPMDRGEMEQGVSRVAVIGRPNVGKSSLINRYWDTEGCWSMRHRARPVMRLIHSLRETGRNISSSIRQAFEGKAGSV